MSNRTDWIELPVTTIDVLYAEYYKQTIDENNGVNGQYFVDPDSWQGFIVEFAAQRLFPDAEIGRTTNGHDIFDYKWHGKVIDVKAGLAVNCDQFVKKREVNIFVFGKLVGHIVYIYGWLTREEVGKCRRKIKTARYDPYYNIPMYKLHPMKEFA